MWPFSEIWGEDREPVRDFLKQAWTKAVRPGNAAETNYQTVSDEARGILQVRKRVMILLHASKLQHWWTNEYRGSGTVDMTKKHFGEFLKTKYKDNLKANYQDNRGRGSRNK